MLNFSNFHANATTAATASAQGAGGGAALMFLETACQWLTGRWRCVPGAVPPSEAISADLTALLGLTPSLEAPSGRTRRDNGPFSVGVARKTVLPDRVGSLASLEATAVRWIEEPRRVANLASVGLTVAQVRRHLDANVESYEQGLPARSYQGLKHRLLDFPDKPSVQDLVTYAVQDAQTEQAFGEFRESVALAAQAYAASSSRAGVVWSAGIDIEQRDAALARVRAFGDAATTKLRQFGTPTTAGFFGLADGQVRLDTLEDALSVIPCASYFRTAPDGSLRITYPQIDGDAARLRQVRVRGIGEVYVARGTNPNRVRYSLDKGRTWNETARYVDDTVEAAKLTLWAAIVMAHQRARARFIAARPWMGW